MFLGVTRDPTRPFYVTDLYMPLQTNSGAFCNPTAQGMQEAMWFAEDNHLQPWQVLSIWIHTHPHMSANPSGTDESTFRDYFLDKHTSAMCILSKTGDTYARIQVSNSRALLTKVVPFDLPRTPPREDPLSKNWYELLASQTKEESHYRTTFQSSGGYTSDGLSYDEALQRWVMEENPQVQEGKALLPQALLPAPTQGTAKALNLLAKDPQPIAVSLEDKSLEALAWKIVNADADHSPSTHPAYARYRSLPWADKQLVDTRVRNIQEVQTYWKHHPRK